MYKEFEQVVYSFMVNKKNINKQVFFGVLYHSKDTQRHFVTHNFKTVPHLTVSLQKQKRNDMEEFYKEEDKWLVRGDEIYDSHKILEFFNKRLGTNVQITYPLSTIIIKNAIFFAIFVAAFTAVRYLRLIML